MKSWESGSKRLLNLLWTSHISSYANLEPHLLIQPLSTQWQTQLHAVLSDYTSSFESLIIDFLKGTGIPCAGLFADAKTHFNHLVELELSNIDQDGFRPQMFCWAATSSCDQEINAGRIQVISILVGNLLFLMWCALSRYNLLRMMNQHMRPHKFMLAWPSKGKSVSGHACSMFLFLQAMWSILHRQHILRMVLGPTAFMLQWSIGFYVRPWMPLGITLLHSPVTVTHLFHTPYFHAHLHTPFIQPPDLWTLFNGYHIISFTSCLYYINLSALSHLTL